MRKTLKFFAALLLCVGVWQMAFAQDFTQRGNFVIGSTLGFASNNSNVSGNAEPGTSIGEGPESFQWNIAPRVGYFLFDNFTLGIGADYTRSEEQRTGESKTKDSDLLFGPYVRYFIPFGGDKAFFFEGSFGFGNSSDNLLINGNLETYDSNIMAFGAGPGFTIFSNDAIGIETLFKYNYAQSKFTATGENFNTEITTKTNQFSLSVGLNFYFAGFRRAGQ